MSKFRKRFRVYAPGYEFLGISHVRASKRQAFVLADKLGIGSSVMPFRKFRDGSEEYTRHYWVIVEDKN